MTDRVALFPKVDFFCIGAAKCGSTWLAKCVDEHPAITVAKGKETNFFVKNLSVFSQDKNPKFLADWGHYHSLYQHGNPDDLLGDFSINMLHNIDTAPAAVAKYYPDARFILTLRDPVDRTYSHYWHERQYDRRSATPPTFEEALRYENLLFRSLYFEQLSAWLRYFDLTQFFFVLDFELKVNRKEVLQRLFQFLGVASDFVPPSCDKRINIATARSPLLIAAERISETLRQGTGHWLTHVRGFSTIERLIRTLGKRPLPYPEMAIETRKKLKAHFLSDIKQLEGTLGQKLDPWKS